MTNKVNIPLQNCYMILYIRAGYHSAWQNLQYQYSGFGCYPEYIISSLFRESKIHLETNKKQKDD
jgi:hypothetical protein